VSEVDVVSVRAPSFAKLEKELIRLLADCPADAVLGVSHATASLETKQSGGIWAGARHTTSSSTRPWFYCVLSSC
jgi:hypothetical protein